MPFSWQRANIGKRNWCFVFVFIIDKTGTNVAHYLHHVIDGFQMHRFNCVLGNQWTTDFNNSVAYFCSEAACQIQVQITNTCISLHIFDRLGKSLNSGSDNVQQNDLNNIHHRSFCRVLSVDERRKESLALGHCRIPHQTLGLRSILLVKYSES